MTSTRFVDSIGVIAFAVTAASGVGLAAQETGSRTDRAPSPPMQVAVPVAEPGRVDSPYATVVLPATDTVSLSSTVGRLEEDAQFLKKWVIDHGFVQIGATRMSFHDSENADASAIRITIIYPVTRMTRLQAPPCE